MSVGFQEILKLSAADSKPVGQISKKHQIVCHSDKGGVGCDTPDVYQIL